MNIRLISGAHGGRKIAAPDTLRTHPMSERVRNALFNSLAGDIDGAAVLDVFAGSGAVGLEALSRGAAQVTFIEKDRVAQNSIAKNIALLNEESRAKLVRTAAANWLETAAGDAKFDLIFADPPYNQLQFSTVRRLFGLLKPGATMVLSHPGNSEVPSETGIVVVDNRSYGTANLTFYRREDA